MRPTPRTIAIAVALALLAAVGLAVQARFAADLDAATARAFEGSTVVATRCGPIEVQQAGQGSPVLVVHGSGGGHDQGMAFARPLAERGLRVIAVSRFGYLRTPRPADASPAAQAEAHVCLLDALGVERAAVVGVSAGAPSALQMALRHPDRTTALVLVVPILPQGAAGSDAAPAPPPWVDTLLMRLLGSDFVFWSALQIARDAVIRHVLATPPALVDAADGAERARVLDLAARILPVSARAPGLRDDTLLGRGLGPEALEAVAVPTLLISARDDGYGTFGRARDAARRIPGATFIGFDTGGHLLVGHDDEVQEAIADLVRRSSR